MLSLTPHAHDQVVISKGREDGWNIVLFYQPAQMLQKQNPTIFLGQHLRWHTTTFLGRREYIFVPLLLFPERILRGCRCNDSLFDTSHIWKECLPRKSFILSTTPLISSIWGLSHNDRIGLFGKGSKLAHCNRHQAKAVNQHCTASKNQHPSWLLPQEESAKYPLAVPLRMRCRVDGWHCCGLPWRVST